MIGNRNALGTRANRVIVGQRFGSWEVLSDTPFEKCGALYVRARCRCGLEREANLRFLETGRSTQCKGCHSRQVHERQGHTISPARELRLVQQRVSAMVNRCQNPKNRSYHNYGGRGIEFRFASRKAAVDYILCELQCASYVGLDIDRRENNGHYEPGNLILRTRSENLKNKRSSICLTPALEHALLWGLVLCRIVSTE